MIEEYNETKCYFCFKKLSRFQQESLSNACAQCANAIQSTTLTQADLEFWLLRQIYE